MTFTICLGRVTFLCRNTMTRVHSLYRLTDQSWSLIPSTFSSLPSISFDMSVIRRRGNWIDTVLIVVENSTLQSHFYITRMRQIFPQDPICILCVLAVKNLHHPIASRFKETHTKRNARWHRWIGEQKKKAGKPVTIIERSTLLWSIHYHCLLNYANIYDSVSNIEPD